MGMGTRVALFAVSLLLAIWEIAAESQLSALQLNALSIENLVGSPLFGVPTLNETRRGTVQFGATVALASRTGSRLVVGAPDYDFTTPFADSSSWNQDCGAIFVYEFNTATGDWNVDNPLWFLAGISDEGLGDFLSFNQDGTRLAVRRYHQVPNPVEVYDIDTGLQVGPSLSCLQSGNTRVNGDTVTLSADGTRLAMSCRTNSGHVEVFDFNTTSNEWEPIGRLSGLAHSDLFGFATAFSANGNRLIVSSPGHDGGALYNRGMVQVFDYVGGTTWVQVGSNLVGNAAQDQLGFAADMNADGSVVVASAPSSSRYKHLEGSVHSYRYNGNDWIELGTIFGVEESDRFGRSIAISDSGNYLAASSWFHLESRGHVLMFRLWYGQDWVNIGSISGDERGDRMGYGRFSVSMKGDGNRLAIGSTRSRNSDGESTGRVLVLDHSSDLQDSSEVPSNSPTVLPSMRPSASPSKEPTLSPSQVPTFQEPSASPSEAPTSFPSTGAPTSPPSSVPTGVPTSPPSSVPSEAPSFSLADLGKFDWDLNRNGTPVVIRFAEDTDTEEIMMTYITHRRQSTVRIFEEDCVKPVSLSVVGVNKTATPISSSHSELQIYLDIKQDTVQDSPIFAQDSVETGLVSFCIRVDLMTDGSQLGSPPASVVFREQKIFVSIDLTDNFTITSVDLKRKEAEKDIASVDAEYNVTACHCNENLECINETVVQNTVVAVCVEAVSPDVEIAGIRAMELIQGSISLQTIVNGTEDGLTEVSLHRRGNSNMALIQTQLLSAFFLRDDPPDVAVNGTCTLTFVGANSTRRLRTPLSISRNLLESERESDFTLHLQLSNDHEVAQASAAATVSITSVLVAVLVWIPFLG